MQNDTKPFTDFAASQKGRIDEALDEYTTFPSAQCPVLVEAMRYSLLSPGKRLRPLLVLMAAEACGGSIDDALPAACAVEMVHAFSLIHDDLPCMDDDDLRRGLPTCHKKFGEAQALLAGDALLSHAFDLLAQLEPADVAVSCSRELASAVGPLGMIGGQSIDVGDLPDNIDAAFVEHLHQSKTGALITASLRLGALVAGAGDDELADITQYGWSIGLAFQITDDLLDAEEGASEDKSYPSIVGEEKSRFRAKELIDEACLAVASFEHADRFEALACSILSRES